jgi:hypothetical protein
LCGTDSGDIAARSRTYHYYVIMFICHDYSPEI